MDEFKQHKLFKSEWDNMEKTIDSNELSIVQLIKNGYNNIDIYFNPYHTLKELIKIEHNDSDYYIYIHIIKPYIHKNYKKYNFNSIKLKKPKKNLSSSDKIRIENVNNIIQNSIEQTILDLYKKYCKSELNTSHSILYYYNIQYLFSTYKINPYLKESFIFNNIYKPNNILQNCNKIIENNPIFYYKNVELYNHQKEIFSIVKKKEPFLCFYMTPTCSGKTLTPIALSNEYKIIFICASRHIGINLSKSAINVNTKCGFAFGCNSEKDIRLHYFSISSYDKYKHPDHTNGSKLELLISDIHSYKYAMNYMLKHFEKDKIILFWDEPTITMDYDEHPLHKHLKNIWNINIIPRVILSSATLPCNLEPIINNFRNKFENSLFYPIEECNIENNIILVDENNEVIMPHNYFKTIDEIKYFIKIKGKNYMKFLSVSECANYILESSFSNEFNELNFIDINANKIKEFYYKIIQKELFVSKAKTNFNNDINFTTQSASSIKYGPALWIVQNIDYYIEQLIQNSNIKNNIIQQLNKEIEYNNNIYDKVTKLSKDYQDKISKFEENENKMKELRFDNDTKTLLKKIEHLEKQYKKISLNELFIPNTLEHYEYWSKNENYNTSNVFKGEIDENYIKQIIELDVSFNYKLLLILGIGVLHKTNLEYNSIMKDLADSKKLMLIIASSDYIYGTNYQFAHAYLSEDVENITQEKLIQSIGRVGRKEKNKTFTFRFRSNQYLDNLFKDIYGKEQNKMIELFS